MADPRAIYIHIPFCGSKCAYCDFLSMPASEEVRARYVDRLIEEIDRRAHGLRPRTLYIGGGTPTALGAETLARLFGALASRLDLTGLREFTVEANPATVDAGVASVLVAGGVNRVSIGAQSFAPGTLSVLGRAHGPEDTRIAVDVMRAAGIDNISIDLIYGVPGQTLEGAAADVVATLALRPFHVSAYCLSVHEETPLAHQLAEGRLSPVPDETQREMYVMICRRFERAGFKQYEISNFALTRWRSKHNMTYWRNDLYLGLGLGAVSYDGRTRSTNTRELGDYLDGRFGPQESETLPARRRAQQTLILALRLVRGIAEQDVIRRTGSPLEEFLSEEVRRFISSGHLLHQGGRLRLARKSLFVADEILQAFLD